MVTRFVEPVEVSRPPVMVEDHFLIQIGQIGHESATSFQRPATSFQLPASSFQLRIELPDGQYRRRQANTA
jgi:hypothetical protein